MTDDTTTYHGTTRERLAAFAQWQQPKAPWWLALRFLWQPPATPGIPVIRLVRVREAK